LGHCKIDSSEKGQYARLLIAINNMHYAKESIGGGVAKMTRVPIPTNLSAKILVAHDRTCCVCHERGKRVQIHHIDENNSNNDDVNLATLCFDCHDLTMIKGGFGRSLDAAQVTQYRDEWVARVAELKKKADETLLQKQVGVIDVAGRAPKEWEQPGTIEMAAYIESLPDTMQRAYVLAQPDWNGANLVKAQATYQVIRVAEKLWIGLTACYPTNHIGGVPAEEFTFHYITDRFDLRHALMEPGGERSGGTMVIPMVAYGVLLDVQALIVTTVRMMVGFSVLCSKIDLEDWQKRFREATNSYETAGH
jgi:hypothetical protein